MGGEVGGKGQVTIFIIIALLIITGVIIAFFFYGKFDILKPEQKNPRQFIDKCIGDAIMPSVGMVLENGGRITPANYLVYKDKEYNYLCYTPELYKTCTNTYPRLKGIVEEEIKQDADERVKNCFDELKLDLDAKGYSVSDEGIDWNVEVLPGKIRINVNKAMEISKEGNSESFNEFNSYLVSHLYELVMIAREVANQESQYCNFEYNGFMILYPEFKIYRIDYDNNKIYKIIYRKSGEEMDFAVRSCAFPGGF